MHLDSLHRTLFAALLTVTTVACSPGLFTSATTFQTPHGEVTAVLGDDDEFPHFDMPDHGVVLAEAQAEDVTDDSELLIVDRDGSSRALLLSEMTWHHVAQGTLEGRPIAVVYCVVCDMGMGVTPEIDGRTLHVSAGGLSNGVVMLRDAETGSYWNSFTGEAVTGPLAGRTMPTFGLRRMRVAEARRTEPQLELVRSDISTYGTYWSRSVLSITRTPDGYLPGYFRKSFDRQDPRRPESELGLGVVVGGQARFYPACELNKCASPVVDSFGGSSLVIAHDDLGLGHADATVAAEPAFAVWGRWYGFSASFPACEVWTAPIVAMAPAAGDDVPELGVARSRAPCMDR